MKKSEKVVKNTIKLAAAFIMASSLNSCGYKVGVKTADYSNESAYRQKDALHGTRASELGPIVGGGIYFEKKNRKLYK